MHSRAMLRWSLREIQHGQLWPIILAIVLVVASVFSLAALVERMQQVMVKQGKDALTADAIYISDQQIPEDILNSTSAFSHSQMTRFSSMLFSGDDMKLSMVKAVDDEFPLRGQMDLKAKSTLSHVVKPNEVWVEASLAQSMGIKAGDAITLGDWDTTLSGVIEQEPGVNFNPFRQMPTVLIHRSDLEKTGAVQMGSRVQQRLFLAGNEDALKKFIAEHPAKASDRWRTDTNQRQTGMIFEKTTQFLSLVVIVIVLMAALTLVITSQHYAKSRNITTAMLKSLGASKRWIVQWLVLQVVSIMVIGVAIGLGAGIALERLLRIPIAAMLPDPLPAISASPFVLSITCCIVITIPTIAISLSRLANTPATNVLSGFSHSAPTPWVWSFAILPVIAGGFLLKDNLTGWLVLGAVIILFLLLAMIGYLAVLAIHRLPIPVALRLATKRITRSRAHSLLQFGALTMSLMLVSTLWVIRSDLLNDWATVLPQDAPNVFALNIAPYEKDQYLNTLTNEEVMSSPAFPIIRGRLTEINGQDAKAYAGGEEKSDALRRELNFTYSETIPDYNPVLQGEWNSQGEGVSIEQNIAEELGVKIGDRLTFSINSQMITATVNSIRDVEWRDMKPNFYFIFTPESMASMPATWLVSFRITGNDAVLNQLARQFPTVSLIDLRKLTQSIQQLLSQVVDAITLLSLMSVLAGLLLIFTLLRLSLGQRSDEIRLYRTLGSGRRMIATTIWGEFGIQGLLAAIVACAASEGLIAIVLTKAFEIDWQFHVWLWVVVPVLTLTLLYLVLRSMLASLLTPIHAFNQ